MSIIRFESVSYVYPNGVKALDEINLEIDRGELVAIMGENGAGKTTLLKHMNGLLRPTKGTVYVYGKDTRGFSVAELSRRVGMVFQSAEQMFFSSSVKEEVEFALKNFKMDDETIRRRVDWALKFMELDMYANRSPFLLSGGEKKRLALAIVLAWNPEVLVLDEPTVGQDPMQKEKLAGLIKQLILQGRTVVISTHDVEFVSELRPRVILMSRGKIVADGDAEDILTDEDLLKRCSLLMPQVPYLLKRLSDIGFDAKVLTVEDAVATIVGRLKKLEHAI